MLCRVVVVSAVACVSVFTILLGPVDKASAASPVGNEIEIQATAPKSDDPKVAYNHLHEEFLVVWWNFVDVNSWDVWGCSGRAERRRL